MCARYTLTTTLETLQERFHFQAEGLPYQPRYNIAPTQEVLTIVRNGENRAQYMRWGLIPFWAKDPKVGYKMINARAEGLADKSAFRNALKKRRCLVLADGFYDWREESGVKVPMRILLKSREPFAFAGLWEVWKAPAGEYVRSCTIVTTAANPLVATIHDRMPVILSEEAERIWLDMGIQDFGVLSGILSPFPAGSMEAYRVSPIVNSAKNETPACIAPVD